MRPIAEHELGARVADHEFDGGAGTLDIHRHCDETRAHDAVTRREILGPVGRKNCRPVAARESTIGDCVGRAIGHRIEVSKGELARLLLAAEVDDGDLVEVPVPPDEIAKIVEHCGQPFGAAVRYIPRPLASSLPCWSKICASATANWLPQLTTLPRRVRSPGMAGL